MSTRTFDREAFVRSVVETIPSRLERSPGTARPFRAGSWLVGTDNKVLAAVPARSRDPEGNCRDDAREKARAWLDEALSPGLETTVAALRKWAGRASYSNDLDRVGTLAGQPINRRLLVHLIAYAPAGKVMVQVCTGRPRLVRIRGESWTGLVAPLDTTTDGELATACAANVFTP